ncbi:hypothetical protein ABIB57_003777 [Devosia sp. UYZn731]
MPLIPMADSMLFTSPFGGEVGAQRRVKGPLARTSPSKGPLTRPKRVDLSPKGEVKVGRPRVEFQ